MKKHIATQFLKKFSLWVFGIGFVSVLYAQLSIPSHIDNAVQTIGKIVLTQDGTAVRPDNPAIVTIDSNSDTPFVVTNTGGQTAMTVDSNGNMISSDPTKAPNKIIGAGSASVGGYDNDIQGDSSLSVGSNKSKIQGNQSSIVGGYNNTINAQQSFIVGGFGNTITKAYSAIIASLTGTVNGLYSVIIGGSNNRVDGNNSTAGGQNAQALHPNTWIWSDYDDSYDPVEFSSTKSNTFLIRALNGVGINTNTPTDNASGKQALTVNGVVGATKYCDIDGANCILPSNVSPAEKDPTTRDLTDNFIPRWSAALGKFIDSYIWNKGSRVVVLTGIEIQGDIKSPGLWAKGAGVQANGDNSMAIGRDTVADGLGSFAAGYKTVSKGTDSFSIGGETLASGDYSVAMGSNTTANGKYSMAIGSNTTANGDESVAMGGSTVANGENSVAMGASTQAIGMGSLAVGFKTIAQGKDSFAIGMETKAIGDYSVAMGNLTQASGRNSLAFGKESIASSDVTVAIGNQASATAVNAVAIGHGVVSEGDSSLALGEGTKASNEAATAMGWSTEANGFASTSMGYGTIASGFASTSLGYSTKAYGDRSTAMGYRTRALGVDSTVIGNSNIGVPNALFEIGNGYYSGDIDAYVASNAMTVLTNGNVGIGITSPSVTLDVDGKIRASISIETPTLIVDKLVNRTVSNITVSGQLLPDPLAPVGSQTIGSLTSGWKELYAGGITALSNGNVGIGTISPSSTLTVSGTVSVEGDVYANNYYMLSDSSKKTDIVLLAASTRSNTPGVVDKNANTNLSSSVVSKLLALTGIEYTLTSDSNKGVSERHMGFKAEDVKASFPNATKEASDGTLYVSYIGLIAPIVEALKSQQAQISYIINTLIVDIRLQITNIQNTITNITNNITNIQNTITVINNVINNIDARITNIVNNIVTAETPLGLCGTANGGNSKTQPTGSELCAGGATLIGNVRASNDTWEWACDAGNGFGSVYCKAWESPDCGNNRVQAGESCDDGNNNGKNGYCNEYCTGLTPYCGDGIENNGEECDDGPSGSTTCTSECKHIILPNPVCGDNIVNQTSEQCDNGPSGSSTCTSDCKTKLPPNSTCTTNTDCPSDKPICSGYKALVTSVPYKVGSYLPSSPERLSTYNGGIVNLTYEGSSDDKYVVNNADKVAILKAWDPEWTDLTVGTVIDWNTYFQALTKEGMPSKIPLCAGMTCTVGTQPICYTIEGMGTNSTTTNYVYASHSLQASSVGKCIGGVIYEKDGRRSLDPIHDSLNQYNGFTSTSAQNWCTQYASECKSTSCEFFFTNTTSCSGTPVGSSLTCNYTAQSTSQSNKYAYNIHQCESPDIPAVPGQCVASTTNPAKSCISGSDCGAGYTCNGYVGSQPYCDGDYNYISPDTSYCAGLSAMCTQFTNPSDCNNYLENSNSSDGFGYDARYVCGWKTEGGDQSQQSCSNQEFDENPSLCQSTDGCTWHPAETISYGQCVLTSTVQLSCGNAETKSHTTAPTTELCNGGPLVGSVTAQSVGGIEWWTWSCGNTIPPCTDQPREIDPFNSCIDTCYNDNMDCDRDGPGSYACNSRKNCNLSCCSTSGKPATPGTVCDPNQTGY